MSNKTIRDMKTEETKPSNPDLHKGAVGVLQDRTTLRDYFAGLAMQSCINLLLPTEIHTLGNQEWVSEIGYKVADAMLKQRES